ncbi:hypothetical protein FHS29_000009 [Saccharothrix tamanrassetensis]|uniref:Uncharacterized protein n=1 Tax=Saccharothrix tamanrassetensis TaxID=1051531 RepID=A0A841C7P6_9PSEU|nr:hypothetical protein [Saccharothrix tamanrassetensis]MBB5953439.1 hypothetical protein [Saccharothrix tamanrassetensis]
MSSNLERRYRALLRVLPVWYRAEREEEMVGIFLAGRDGDLDAEYGWPGWGEAWATLGLAVRVRLRARSRAGDVVRLVASAGLLGHVVSAAQGAAAVVRFGGVWTGWFDALVVAAFVGLVAGRRVMARVAVAVAALCGVVVALRAALSAGPVGWVLVVQVPLWVTAVAVLLGFHREAPPVARVRWSVAAVVGAVVGAVWGFLVPLSMAGFGGAWLVAAAVVVVFRPWAGVRAGTPVSAG